MGDRVRSIAVPVVAAAAMALGVLGCGRAQNRPSNQVQVVITMANLSAQLRSQPPLTLSSTVSSGPLISVDPRVRYQHFTGVGAAITDSSAYLISRLPAARRRQLMSTLFSPAGLHLGFIRLPVGASDYTRNGMPYSYDEQPAGHTDPGLAHFSIDHDAAYILPVARAALAENPKAFVLAEPWSPPSWMKANDALGNVGDLGTLRPQDYGPLAHYLVDFLRDYAAQGIHIDAITPQNEPENPTIYPGLNLSEPDEARLIVKNLVPALRAADLHPSIFGYDNGWSSQSLPFATALARSPAAAALTGIATHCYYGSPNGIGQLHHENPRLTEIVSECSPGITPFPASELLISAMRNWASAVALWNLALDPQGGPVQAPNHGCPGCTGVVTINPVTGRATTSLAALQLGQVSRFVTPGAVRIKTNHLVGYRYLRKGTNIATPGLDDVAFENPNHSTVLIAFNNGTATTPFSVNTGTGSFSYALKPGETATFVWK